MTNQLSADERRGDTAPATLPDTGPATRPTAATSRRFRRSSRPPRISRWDRPPEPHDWRYFVSTLGRVLIATGLLMFGFAAYQLWGTGIETARAQSRLEDKFTELLVATGTTDSDVSIMTTAPGDTAPASDAPEIVAGDVTPAIPVAIDLSGDAVEQEPIPQPFRGDPLLRLEIPAIGRDDIVVPGVHLDDLKDGPGHYPDTPLPGQLGNAAIAGHRTTYGAPFFDVDQLQSGDEIITTLLNGGRFVYEVTSVEIVSATDYWVVTTRDPDIAELTLTSCHPKYTARDRIVVHSVLNPEKSSNVGLPTFYRLDDDAGDTPIEGDDPVLSADGIEVTTPDSVLGERNGTTSDDPDSPSSPGDDDTDVAAADVDDDDQPRPVTDRELADARAATADADPIDAFSQGWFDDRAAFPQIALWGLVLTMIAVFSYRLSKRFRRYSVGLVVGIAPFLVGLYFFYQNVNRLLPPGI